MDERPGQQSQKDTRLHGRWLIFARVLWLAIFLLMLVVFCANLVVGHYGLVPTILIVINTSVWFAVSLVLFWRKSNDRAVLLISLTLVLIGGFLFPPLPLALWNNPAWRIPIDMLGLLAGTALTSIYMFPDGQFVPGFTRWLATGWVLISLVPVPTPGAFYPWHWWLSPLYTLVRLTFYSSLALALLYRYRRVATLVQRQQIKWVIYASTILIGDVVIVNLLFVVLPSSFPSLALPSQLHQFVSSLAFYLLPAIFPFSIGIALLRYRLWELDLIIKRTLIYGLLSVLLALIYFVLVLGLESLERLFTTGQVLQSPVIIVVSTLVIAALFHPLRRRTQQIIDRRFYRNRYDAARTLETFSATLRSEVDLEQLSEQLLSVVQQTMNPTFVSFWLCSPPSDSIQQASQD